MFFVHWEQHPVGHGGFHSGYLQDANGPTFRWAFDCGSRMTRKFDSYLRVWTRRHQQPLDWLFISHFDSDHVSGLDVVMGNTVVRDVMLPYLNDRELAFLLLHEIARDTLSRSIVELTADPAAFFLSRGAARVTYLRGDNSRDDPDAAPVDFDPPEGDRGWRSKIWPPPRAVSTPMWAVRPDGTPPVRVIDGGTCEISVLHQTYGMKLKPYRAPVLAHLRRSLILALKSLVGTTVIPLAGRPGLGGLAYAVANYARTQANRHALRALFKTYAGSSNRSSLSLLSEPIANDAENTSWDVRGSNFWSHGSGVPAWVNTGDAELLGSGDLADWQRNYAPELPRVRAIALPHHGSDKNSDAKFAALFPHAVLAAHVKSKSSKHPGSAVITASGRQLTRVTEDCGSKLSMSFQAS